MRALRAVLLAGAWALAGCHACGEADLRALEYPCQRDGGPEQCLGAWRCGLEGHCFDPATPEARRCERGFETSRDAGYDCAPGWRCGLDGLCFDGSSAEPRACDRQFELSRDAGYDCAPGWRCGLGSRCQSQAVGGPYPCDRDTDCEQSWRCNLVEHACVLVTDRIGGGGSVPAFERVSPLLDAGTPTHLAVGTFTQKPFPDVRNPGNSRNSIDGSLVATIERGLLHLLLAPERAIAVSPAPGDDVKAFHATCPIDEAAVTSLTVWDDVAAVARTDGTVRQFALAFTVIAPGVLQWRCAQLADYTPQPPVPGGIKKVRAVNVPGWVRGWIAADRFGLDAPDASVVVAPGLGGGTLQDLAFSRTPVGWAGGSLFLLSEAQVRFRAGGLGGSADSGIQTGWTPIFPPDAGLTAFRVLESHFEAPLPYTPPPPSQEPSWFWGVLSRPTDGGATVYATSVQVMIQQHQSGGGCPPDAGCGPPPDGGSGTPAVQVDAWANNRGTCSLCPGTTVPLAVNALARPAGNSNGSPLTFLVHCSSGSEPSTGFSVAERTWEVRCDCNSSVFCQSGTRYTAFDEDYTPFLLPVRDQESNAAVRAHAGPNGQLWYSEPLVDPQTSTRMHRLLLDRPPEVLFRPLRELPDGGYEKENLIAVEHDSSFKSSELGLVVDNASLSSQSTGVSVEFVGSVRGAGAGGHVISKNSVFNLFATALGGDMPQIVAQRPALQEFSSPTLGEMIRTADGGWQLYVSSFDTIMTADVTAQERNPTSPPALLTAGFTPIPGVPIQSFSVASTFPPDGGARELTGYVIARGQVYAFTAAVPVWRITNLNVDIQAGSPIEVLKDDARAGGAFRVGYDTGIVASLPAPVPLTPRVPGTVSHYTQLCGDTYALTEQGLFQYRSADAGVWAKVSTSLDDYLGARIYPAATSLFLSSATGQIDEISSARAPDGTPYCR